MLIDWRRFAVLLGMGAAALVGGIAAHGLFEDWRQEGAIAANERELFNAASSYVAGNPDGDVTIVSFFDHNCPYCRRDAPALSKLVADDKKIRLVLKELPVLGPDSEAVAKVALAAGRQGKYFELYERLFAAPGRATEGRALQIAGELGLDQDRLKRDTQDPAIASVIGENRGLASKLKVRGVPFYVVGDRVFTPGGGDFYAELAEQVAEARSSSEQPRFTE